MDNKPLVCPLCQSEIIEKIMPYGKIYECINSQCIWWGSAPSKEIEKLMKEEQND